jgi:hypothetical protein
MDVWEAMLDDRYDCRVVWTESYRGRLTVKDIVDGNILLDEEVGLAYDAQFGPDISDVYLWEDKCVAVVPKPES